MIACTLCPIIAHFRDNVIACTLCPFIALFSDDVQRCGRRCHRYHFQACLDVDWKGPWVFQDLLHLASLHSPLDDAIGTLGADE